MSIVVLENYINGEFVASAATETLDLINPVDESVVGRTPVSTKEDVDAAVEAAQRAFETWGKTTPSVRQAALLKLADAIEAHSDEIVAAESANNRPGPPDDRRRRGQGRSRSDAVLRRSRTTSRGQGGRRVHGGFHLLRPS